MGRASVKSNYLTWLVLESGEEPSEFKNPSQVETPYRVAGIQPGLLGLYLTIGHYPRQSVLEIDAEHETGFRGQPYRKSITEVVPLEIVIGLVAYQYGL
jgi:hypothetical protein